VIGDRKEKEHFLLSPITYHLSPLSEFVFIIVFVEVILFDNIQFDRIESDDFQLSSAILARDDVAFVRVRIDVDVRIAFRACSGRHFISPSVLLR
jgi:hypothetical protein